MELIQTISVGSGGASSIEFTSIPATYDDLALLITARSTAGSGTKNLRIKFNSSTSNFTSRILMGTGSSATSFTETNYLGEQTIPANTASTFASFSVYIPNYRSTVAKSFSTDSVSETNGTTAYQTIIAGLWNPGSNVAITSIGIEGQDPSLAEGSSASLYGIRKFNTSAQPKATGGAISFDAVNNKWVHVFTASGTFTPNTNLTDVEYLVIAGGGGGGSQFYGAGGGAGGYRSSVVGESSGGGASAESRLSISSGSAQTVTVGAGGASITNGSNSVFGSITATGGGRGGYEAALSGASGGSGGGGSLESNRGASGTANQGYAGGGGNSPQVNEGGAGGGGGAGSVGALASGFNAGNGGSGVTSSITGTAIARAGGGGGSGYASTSWVQGVGQAGGGSGTRSGNGTAALANSGSGGGGSGGNGSGGAGGSGIVIVRYDA